MKPNIQHVADCENCKCLTAELDALARERDEILTVNARYVAIEREYIAERDALREALKEIARGEGAFSRDHLKHAENCIENMKVIAKQALVQSERGTDAPALRND